MQNSDLQKLLDDATSHILHGKGLVAILCGGEDRLRLVGTGAGVQIPLLQVDVGLFTQLGQIGPHRRLEPLALTDGCPYVNAFAKHLAIRKSVDARERLECGAMRMPAPGR